MAASAAEAAKQRSSESSEALVWLAFGNGTLASSQVTHRVAKSLRFTSETDTHCVDTSETSERSSDKREVARLQVLMHAAQRPFADCCVSVFHES